jgi:hypothetical protein
VVRRGFAALARRNHRCACVIPACSHDYDSWLDRGAGTRMGRAARKVRLTRRCVDTDVRTGPTHHMVRRTLDTCVVQY